jgi:hypothetical protein
MYQNETTSNKGLVDYYTGNCNVVVWELYVFISGEKFKP